MPPQTDQEPLHPRAIDLAQRIMTLAGQVPQTHWGALLGGLLPCPESGEAQGPAADGLEAWRVLAGSVVVDEVNGGVFNRTGPHEGGFGKDSLDQAMWIELNCQAYLWTHEDRAAQLILQAADYVDNVLTDHGPGGFYRGQSAQPEDYHFWSAREIALIVEPEDQSLAELLFPLPAGAPQGPLPHPTCREKLANTLGLSLEQVQKQIDRIRLAMHEARQMRQTPEIDRSIYSLPNAMLISALLRADRLMMIPESRRAALAALSRLSETLRVEEPTRMAHFFDADQDHPARPGMLADQAAFITALLDGLAHTGHEPYLNLALELGGFCAEKLAGQGGHLRVRISDDGEEEALWSDERWIPPGAQLVEAYLRLSQMTGDATWRNRAVGLVNEAAQTLEAGENAAGFAWAVGRLRLARPRVVVLGEAGTKETESLYFGAARLMPLGDAPLRLDTAVEQYALTVRLGLEIQHGRAHAIVCKNGICSAPVIDLASLDERLREISRIRGGNG